MEVSGKTAADLNPGHESDSSGSDRVSEKDWKPIDGGKVAIVSELMGSNVSPRAILGQLHPSMELPPDLPDHILWRLIVGLLTEPPKRSKLPEYNTLDDAVKLITNANKIVVLTGAGISVSCGIPDFRSKDGIYARLHVDFPDLPDPQAMFDISFFRRNPKPFFRFAKAVPTCKVCPPGSEFPVMKPDVVFFGESLGEGFHQAVRLDKEEVDLLLVIGSSMKVGPVNLIPNSIDHAIPQILINRDPLEHLNFDISLLGHCDQVTLELAQRLRTLMPGVFDHLVPQGYEPVRCVDRPPSPTNAPPSTPAGPSTSIAGATLGDDSDNSAVSAPSPSPSSKSHHLLNQKDGDDTRSVKLELSSCSSLRSSKQGNDAAARAEEQQQNRAAGQKIPSSATSQPQKPKDGDDSVMEGEPKLTCSEQELSSQSQPEQNGNGGLTEEQVTQLRAMYSPRRYNLASCLEESSYTFVDPAFTVFNTGEFLMEHDDTSADSRALDSPKL